MNILSNPKVALLFFIPTVAETLRVNGTAKILDDPLICDRFKVKGRAPKTVLRIEAEEIFTHCGKAPHSCWTVGSEILAKFTPSANSF
jgi:predicted pyridoxine 5'-phosphate oxidase superfamily flavin-nucleotide-binding protein